MSKKTRYAVYFTYILKYCDDMLEVTGVENGERELDVCIMTDTCCISFSTCFAA